MFIGSREKLGNCWIFKNMHMAIKKLLFFSVFLLTVHLSDSQFLQTPSFDLLVERNVLLSISCVETRDLDSGSGVPCEHTSEEKEDFSINNVLFSGQSEWRSQALEFDRTKQSVNITLDLREIFLINQITLTSADSPLPAVWLIEGSRDGAHFLIWKYYVSRLSDCEYFGKELALEDVECIVKNSHFNEEKITVNLIQDEDTEDLFDPQWNQASHIRLRFIQADVPDELVSNKDKHKPEIFYSIKQMTVLGGCLCNGHSDRCEPSNMTDSSMKCSCTQNTCGDHCEKCCPGFTQKALLNEHGEKRFSCEETIAWVDFRRENSTTNKSKTVFDVAAKDDAQCYCTLYGTVGGPCGARGKACPCKRGFAGLFCEKCANGFYKYPECLPCSCSGPGAFNGDCDQISGQCKCRPSMRGRTCSLCPVGYYNFPKCIWCGCNPLLTTSSVCYANGRCVCKPNFLGRSCDECQPGYYGHPFCTACACSSVGALRPYCDDLGQCACKPTFGGQRCDRCKDGFYGYPNCRECTCNQHGSLSQNCDKRTGECQCGDRFRGRSCDQCKVGYTGFPVCRHCKCNPAGVKASSGLTGLMLCDGTDTFQCNCKENVGGQMCGKCKELYFGLSASNPKGCEACGCSPEGTIGGLGSCDKVTGQCSCRRDVSDGRCEKCKDGFYGLNKQWLFGCTGCNCNPGSSVSQSCNKVSGKCTCHPNIVGQRCDSLSLKPVYVPSLQHIRVELEDARDTSGTPAQFGHDSTLFKKFSWRGYVLMTHEQPVIIITVTIPRTTKYRIVFCYALNHPGPVTGTLTTSPTQGTIGRSKSAPVVFSPPENGGIGERQFIVVASSRDIREFSFSRGKWDITVSAVNSKLLLDFVTFIPREYYTAEILTDKVASPCLMNEEKFKICNQFTHVNFTDPDVVHIEAEHGCYTPDDDRKKPEEKNGLKLFKDTLVLQELGTRAMAVISKEQPILMLDVKAPKTDEYAMIIQYFYQGQGYRRVDIYFQREHGILYLVPCGFRFMCRQVTTSDGTRVKYFQMSHMETRHVTLMFRAYDDVVAVDSISFVPHNKRVTDYITPVFVCRSYKGSCLRADYTIPSFGMKINPVIAPSLGAVTKEYKKLAFYEVVDSTGPYSLVFHYNSVDSPSLDIAVVVRSTVLTQFTTVLLQPCLNTVGCRSLVASKDGIAQFYLQEGRASIEVEIPRNSIVKVEYLLIIPSSQYTASLLDMSAMSFAKDFQTWCSNDHFNLLSNSIRFCRSLTFSLTTHFNNGPLNCECHRDGSLSTFCERFGGQCKCRPHVIGRTCSRCRSGYYGFPYCKPCKCDMTGAVSTECNSYGQCQCKSNFGGMKCHRCNSFGYFGHPECNKCDCHRLGSLSSFCRQSDGQCQCRRNFQGLKCDRCRLGFFGFPVCEECLCNPAGIASVKGDPQGCNASSNIQCRCKQNVEGEYCDQCKNLYYNLQLDNTQGCDACKCNRAGSSSALRMCEKNTGQCWCKPFSRGRQCRECQDGYHKLKGSNYFGCTGCMCDPGGSLNLQCNKGTGGCACRRNVGGSKCEKLKTKDSYFPDLHHIRAEWEDAKTQAGNPVDYRHSRSKFPGYSHKGYGVFTKSQSELIVEVQIPRSSRYQIMIRYVLDDPDDVAAQVRISPTTNPDLMPSGVTEKQTKFVLFKSTSSLSGITPGFMVLRDDSEQPEKFLFSKDVWRVSVTALSQKLLLDYVTFIPEEYYEALVLKEPVTIPCKVSGNPQYCNDYSYPRLNQTGFYHVEAETGFISGGRSPGTDYKDLTFEGVILNPKNQIFFQLEGIVSGQYVLLTQYFYTGQFAKEVRVNLLIGSKVQKGYTKIIGCKYPFACRQVVLGDNHSLKVFDVTPLGRKIITMTVRGASVALDFISLVPLQKWSMDYVSPKHRCVKTRNNSCIHSTYPQASDVITIQAEPTSSNIYAPSQPEVLDPRVRLLYLGPGEPNAQLTGEVFIGRYVIIVHYYQSTQLAFDSKLIVDDGDRLTSSRLTFNYCPQVYGCRSVGIFSNDKQYVFINRNKVTLSINIPDESYVWIDYVMLIPLRSFSDALLKIKDIDKSRDFFNACDQDKNLMIPSLTKQCKQYVFSMTTQFNEGALTCDCDLNGSENKFCKSYGGQCQCKENVIGRRCDECMPGYTGFPNCVKSAG